MPQNKQLIERALYAHLERKYPYIVPKIGEDLNIQRAKNRILTKLWNSSCSVRVMVRKMGMSERAITRNARRLGLLDKRLVNM